MTALSPSRCWRCLRYALIVALSLTMGAQNATARKLAVPDLTTTVLTLTITGIAADSPSRARPDRCRPQADFGGRHVPRRADSELLRVIGVV